MAGATFTIPLITVIPGQLITAALWNNEFNNISTNLNPSGLDGYSDTDTQMQIQTNPYPGSVTSHATSLGGEIERIRYQISQILGATTPAFWYAAPPTNLAAVADIVAPLGAIIDFPSATPPNGNWLVANGQAIGRTTYASLFSIVGTTFGIGDGTTTFNIPNLTDRMTIAAGNLYSLAATGGAVTSPSLSLTDPGHTHTQNSHTHTMGNHTHSISSDGTGATSGPSASGVAATGSGATNISSSTHTHSGPSHNHSGATGSPNSNNTDSTTPTNNSNTTGITALLTGVASLPPYLGLYKMIRVL